jgi:hypothetical protein
METTRGACGKPLESFETIHVAGEAPLCYPCFNRERAELTIRSMLVPTDLEMEAIERIDDGRAGYRYAVLAEFEADPRELFQTVKFDCR